MFENAMKLLLVAIHVDAHWNTVQRQEMHSGKKINKKMKRNCLIMILTMMMMMVVVMM
jgi:hypothetical protein